MGCDFSTRCNPLATRLTRVECTSCRDLLWGGRTGGPAIGCLEYAFARGLEAPVVCGAHDANAWWPARCPASTRAIAGHATRNANCAACVRDGDLAVSARSPPLHADSAAARIGVSSRLRMPHEINVSPVSHAAPTSTVKRTRRVAPLCGRQTLLLLLSSTMKTFPARAVRFSATLQTLDWLVQCSRDQRPTLTFEIAVSCEISFSFFWRGDAL